MGGVVSYINDFIQQKDITLSNTTYELLQCNDHTDCLILYPDHFEGIDEP